MTPQRKEENDPAQLRRFAKRIAEMKWWIEKSNSENPGESRDDGEQPGTERPHIREDEQRPTQDEQQTSGDEHSAEHEA
jgi:hypothetical protein